MDMHTVVEKFNLYGPIIVFGVLYLEALNLSGIPATVLMPAVGFYIKERHYSFLFIFMIAMTAGILGNLTYYLLAYRLGRKMYHKVYSRFPRTQKPLDKAMHISEKYGSKACFIGRLIPGVRAFISIVSGVFKIEFRPFMLYSLLGIGLWNLITLLIGYLMAIGAS